MRKEEEWGRIQSSVFPTLSLFPFLKNHPSFLIFPPYWACSQASKYFCVTLESPSACGHTVKKRSDGRVCRTCLSFMWKIIPAVRMTSGFLWDDAAFLLIDRYGRTLCLPAPFIQLGRASWSQWELKLLTRYAIATPPRRERMSILVVPFVKSLISFSCFLLNPMKNCSLEIDFVSDSAVSGLYITYLLTTPRLMPDHPVSDESLIEYPPLLGGMVRGLMGISV